MEFFLTGGGSLLITNDAGQRIGYDAETAQMANEFAGARVKYVKGGSPRYQLPLQDADKPYQITVSGKTIVQKVDTNLVMVGPGYVVGFKHIPLGPDQDLMMSISVDGMQLTFDATQTAEAPEVFQAIDVK